MFCVECGNSIRETHKFCSKCGAEVNSPIVGSEPAEPESEPASVAAMNEEPSPPASKRELGTKWDWGYTAIFVLIAIGSASQSFLRALLWIVLSYVISPPGKKRLQSFKRFKYGSLFNVVVLVTGFVLTSGMHSIEVERKKTVAIKREQQEFETNKSKILEDLSDLQESRRYLETVELASKHAHLDEEVKQILANSLKSHLDILTEKEKYEPALAIAEKHKDLSSEISSTYQRLLELSKQAKNTQAIEQIEQLFESGDFEKAWKIAASFSDNKEIAQLAEQLHDKYKSSTERKLLAEAKQIPAQKYKQNMDAYRQLNRLNPDNKEYVEKYKKYTHLWREEYQKEKLQREAKERQERLKKDADLELVNWSWSKGYGYVTAEGQVKSISGKPLKAVAAVVSYFDSSDNFITSDSAVIEYNPILPGQTSPFKVMTKYNPAMKAANLEFKFLFGGKIKTYRK